MIEETITNFEKIYNKYLEDEKNLEEKEKERMEIESRLTLLQNLKESAYKKNNKYKNKIIVKEVELKHLKEDLGTSVNKLKNEKKYYKNSAKTIKLESEKEELKIKILEEKLKIKNEIFNEISLKELEYERKSNLLAKNKLFLEKINEFQSMKGQLKESYEIAIKETFEYEKTFKNFLENLKTFLHKEIIDKINNLQSSYKMTDENCKIII
jgi:hypothetical protein